jgi:hypothetical protein
MTKDKALEDLFLAAKPKFDDKDRFMESLTRRLDAVEYIKQHHEATLRRYRYAMVATFVLGILCGSGVMAFLLSTPVDVPLFTINSTTGFFMFVEQYSRMIAVIMLLLIICLGIVSVITNILEISSMKARLKLGM